MTINNKSERNYRGNCLGWPVTSYDGAQQYRPSGLLKIPIKSTLEALEHSIALAKGLRLQIFSTMAMDILWRNARAFCRLH